MNHRSLRFWRNSRRLTSLVSAAFFLATALPAYAEYKPRDRKAASGYSRGGASRGCPGSSIPLTLLAPKTFVGKTASKRPMLAWYMSNPRTVRFQLAEFISDKKIKNIGKPKEIPATAGINKLKLSTDYSELTAGKKYLWQITIDCEGEDSITSRAEFKVVSQSLAKTAFTTIPESVKHYAQKDLWYEALEEALKKTENGQLSQSGSILVKQLSQLETPIKTDTEEDIKIIKQRNQYLQKISGIEL
ncbi:protein of unknown function (DUF928) [Rivularia sp. PCC 7116]|uniref:DUF928 domain-containing protein n=1 Tax=Rivularia sp. PCC 7116 TaxID=373994 RepID=UPI00029F03BC|nr:DUF928 domain-containing protein [Rivularia sp. PCC 7116]AFY55530.1 protein of unknown function (DUF928) [Rivularia sp. PCC 7116]